MRVVDLIRRKRDAGELTRQEIEFLVAGYTANEIPDYQMAAWLMAVVLKASLLLRHGDPAQSHF